MLMLMAFTRRRIQNLHMMAVTLPISPYHTTTQFSLRYFIKHNISKKEIFLDNQLPSSSTIESQDSVHCSNHNLGYVLDKLGVDH